MWKQFISDYLSFTKRERTGIWVLLTLLFLIILLPFIFPYFIKQKTYDHLVFERAIAELKIKQEEPANRFDKGDFDNRFGKNDEKKTGKYYASNSTKGELFYFDPNVASRSDWEKLGVRDKTIATIQNYLSKGGKFYKKEDIGKIWGFHEEEIKRLMPYIQIAGTTRVNYSER